MHHKDALSEAFAGGLGDGGKQVALEAIGADGQGYIEQAAGLTGGRQGRVCQQDFRAFAERPEQQGIEVR